MNYYWFIALLAVAVCTDTENRSNIDYIELGKITKGKLTYDTEGSLDPKSPYYCAVPHWPAGASGVTIGKGYDMGSKEKGEIIRDLKSAGISEEYARILSEGSKLHKNKAKAFCDENKNIKLTNDQVNKLFINTYNKMEINARRILRKKINNEIPYDKLPKNVQEIVVDYFYQGALPVDKQPQFSDTLSVGLNTGSWESFKNLLNDKLKESPDDNKQKMRCKVMNDDFNIRNVKTDESSSFYNIRNEPVAQDPSNTDTIALPSFIDKSNMKGGVDLSKISSFLDTKGNIKGIYISPHDSRMAYLLTDSSPINTGISMPILAVALLAAYKNESIAFSLDPWDPKDPNGPFIKKVYYPSWIAGTELGDLLFESDYLLKQLSFGIKVKSISPEYTATTEPLNFPLELTQKGLRTVISYESEQTSTSNQKWYRLWIETKECALTEEEDFIGERMLKFEKVNVVIQARRMVISSTSNELEDAETLNDPNEANERFARKATELYEDLAKAFPEFDRIYAAAKATAISKVMRNRNIPVDIPSLEKYVDQHKVGRNHDYKVPTISTELKIQDKSLVRTIRMHGGVSLTQEHTKIVRMVDETNANTTSENPTIVSEVLKMVDENKVIPMPFVLSNEKCSLCGRNVTWNGLYYPVYDNKVYCNIHHPHVCMICHQELTPGTPYIELTDFKSKDTQGLSGKIHFDCFLCERCGKPINDSYIAENSTIPDNEGIYYDSYYHKECYQEMFYEMAPTYKCDNKECPYKGEIKGQDYIKLNNSTYYHSECFKCDICKKRLISTYVEWRGLIICSECSEGNATSSLAKKWDLTAENAINTYNGYQYLPGADGSQNKIDTTHMIYNVYQKLGYNFEYIDEMAWTKKAPAGFHPVNKIIGRGTILVLENSVLGIVLNENQVFGVKVEGEVFKFGITTYGPDSKDYPQKAIKGIYVWSVL